MSSIFITDPVPPCPKPVSVSAPLRPQNQQTANTSHHPPRWSEDLVPGWRTIWSHLEMSGKALSISSYGKKKNMGQFNIFHTNIRGIWSDREGLLHIRQEKDVHVASINETFLSPHMTSLYRDDIIRGDRSQGKGGGVALLFKRPIVYNETITSLSPEQAQNNEFVIAKVLKLEHNPHVSLLSSRCHPLSPLLPRGPFKRKVSYNNGRF